jgi:hypothetical protein
VSAAVVEAAAAPAAAQAVSAALAAPAVAAQTVAVDGTCFVNADPKIGAPVTVSGSGFTPGDSIDLGLPLPLGIATVAADGTFATTVSGPTLKNSRPGQSRFTLTARDPITGTTAATTFRVANLAFRTTPAVAKPSTRVHFTFSGFRARAIIYGHYLLHGKVVATERLGRTRGDCGLLKASARLFPGRRPRFGSYKVQFDDSRRYAANALPRIVSALTIARG